MKVLISGGAGFLGRNLARSFSEDGHDVFVLTRGRPAPPASRPVLWDGSTTKGWGSLMDEIEVVIHLAGRSLASWPWTSTTKRTFYDSRVQSGQALVEAIRQAVHRPRLFIQQSGINHYGLRGGAADEFSTPGDDFLARLTIGWEAATQPVEQEGVRRIVLRSAVVLGKRAGLLPLMALPVRLFFGGPIGRGDQALPWIHLQDWVAAVKHLTHNESAQGPYNLIAPAQTSNAEFNRLLAQVLHRPFWFRLPVPLMRILLGEMNVLILEGRFVQPRRLLDSGYHFQYAEPRAALQDLVGK